MNRCQGQPDRSLRERFAFSCPHDPALQSSGLFVCTRVHVCLCTRLCSCLFVHALVCVCASTAYAAEVRRTDILPLRLALPALLPGLRYAHACSCLPVYTTMLMLVYLCIWVCLLVCVCVRMCPDGLRQLAHCCAHACACALSAYIVKLMLFCTRVGVSASVYAKTAYATGQLSLCAGACPCCRRRGRRSQRARLRRRASCLRHKTLECVAMLIVAIATLIVAVEPREYYYH